VDARAKKLESALKSAKIRKPSHVYAVLVKAEPDEILFLLYHSALKPVQERMRNYFQKYVPAVLEITPEEWAAVDAKAGPKKASKAREEFITNRLDRRPKKPAPETLLPPPPVPEPVVSAGRRGR
jgi:hypothetical protein